jgi:hypothetical protein
MAKTEFEGFANAPVDKKGKVVDFRDVPAYEDTSDAGKKLLASQTTPSSIVDFKTEGKGTNGSPMAVVVPKTADEKSDEADASDADAAGGKEASQS